MTPLPSKPTIVVRVDSQGNPICVASNIAPLPELTIQVVRSKDEFDEAALGKPFNQIHPPIADDYIR